MNDHKPPGRRSVMPQLSAEIQAKIGQQLRKIYDDMVTQGVPDRFVELLDRLEQPGEGDQSDQPNINQKKKESR
ncbi:MAG TPA: NepR family anti-sigma factor [Xanthobacteraceae bacterium]|nr:NepR family anti-sigma factor [Xanthobacteraceae bacterium]